MVDECKVPALQLDSLGRDVANDHHPAPLRLPSQEERYTRSLQLSRGQGAPITPRPHAPRAATTDGGRNESKHSTPQRLLRRVRPSFTISQVVFVCEVNVETVNDHCADPNTQPMP